MDWTSIIMAIIGSSALTTFITLTLNRRERAATAAKTEMEAEAIFDQRYLQLIEKLEKRIEELEKENKNLHSELAHIHKDHSALQLKLHRIAQILIYSAPAEMRQTEIYRSLIQIIK